VFLGKLNNRVLYHCARDIAQEMQHQRLGHQIILEGLALRILIETLRSWPRKAVENCEVDLTPRLPRRDFVRAYEFMRWCRKDTFRLQHLCRFLGSSEGRFTRLFRAATNTSPANFYNRLLLERGRDLLADKTMSIKEISFHLGYKTCSHFVVAFHREFGIPPHAYRQGCDQDSINILDPV
jgi:transcriptional regulator GlxA family with amidase domain